MLQRVRDLKVQYDNGTLSADDKDGDRAPRSSRSPRRVKDIIDRHASSTAQRCSAPTTFTFQVGANDGETITTTPRRPSPATVAAGGLERAHQHRHAAAADDGAAAGGDLATLSDDRQRDQERLQRPRQLRRGAEPPRAPSGQPGDLPGEPDRVRVAHPRRGHGGGDDEVHEAEHPAAGRHEHARAGQPGPAGRPLAAALSASRLQARPLERWLKIGSSAADHSVEATRSRLGHCPSTRSTRSVESWAFVFRTTSRRSTRTVSSRRRARRPRSRWRSSPAATASTAPPTTLPASRISEKMRGQIGGLAQAQRNAQDGISLVQTAEGALNEVHSMLQRVRDLKVQFDNGTLSSDDKDAIAAEVFEIAKEVKSIIDRHEVQRHGRVRRGRRSRSRSAPTTARRSPRRPPTSAARSAPAAPAACRDVTGARRARVKAALDTAACSTLVDASTTRSRTSPRSVATSARCRTVSSTV